MAMTFVWSRCVKWHSSESLVCTEGNKILEMPISHELCPLHVIVRSMAGSGCPHGRGGRCWNESTSICEDMHAFCEEMVAPVLQVGNVWCTS